MFEPLARFSDVCRSVILGGFGDFTGLDALGANFHALCAALWQLRFD